MWLWRPDWCLSCVPWLSATLTQSNRLDRCMEIIHQQQNCVTLYLLTFCSELSLASALLGICCTSTSLCNLANVSHSYDAEVISTETFYEAALMVTEEDWAEEQVTISSNVIQKQRLLQLNSLFDKTHVDCFVG